MAKKTFKDETYGKITFKDNYWLVNDGVKIKVNGEEVGIKTEIDICNVSYEKYSMNLYNDEIMNYYRENPDEINAKEAEKVKKQQKELYKKYLIDGMEQTAHKLEEAALEKRQEIIENQTLESFSRIVGKEKAQRVFNAKTREEKLESLELKKLRVMIDTIEITCICDWFKPSGGFVVFQDGSIKMFYVDSMSI